MKNLLRILVGVVLLCSGAPSFANFAFSPSGATTMFSIDASNQGTSLCAAASTECAAHVLITPAGVPISSAAAGATQPLDVTVRDTSGNAGSLLTLGPAAIANTAPVNNVSQYPTNSVTTTPAPITGNATGSTGAVVGTLSGAASVTTFICGFNVSAIGGTAAVGPITVAGLIGSSQVYQLTSTAAGVMLTQTFNPCIPASAVNTPITVTTTADGSATAVDVNSWGYRL